MNQELINKITKHYGVKHQVGICQEECAELIQALSKFLRGTPDYENIAEEIADVEITLVQMKAVFANEDEVEVWKEFKLLRIQGRMNDELLNNNSTSANHEEESSANNQGEGSIHGYSIKAIPGVSEKVCDIYKLP